MFDKIDFVVYRYDSEVKNVFVVVLDKKIE